MPDTICIACGSPKDDYQDSCPNCGFKPESHEDLAKSRILSWEWDFGLPDGGIVSTGRTPEDLESIAERIRSGEGYEFPPDELEGMTWVIREAGTTSGRDVLKELVLWILPPAAILAAVWFLIVKFG